MDAEYAKPRRLEPTAAKNPPANLLTWGSLTRATYEVWEERTCQASHMDLSQDAGAFAQVSETCQLIRPHSQGHCCAGAV
jgi:hypothetical protein